MLDLVVVLMDGEGELFSAVQIAIAGTEEELYWKNIFA